jgi:hypothetical protein
VLGAYGVAADNAEVRGDLPAGDGFSSRCGHIGLKLTENR